MARRQRSGRKRGGSPPGRLRIVAGKWRGRLLEVADADGLRPTPDRIRETLFNWLAPVVSGARCLDVFAGSGALGLEALSRGAGHAAFVEENGTAVEKLRASLALLEADNAEILVGDAYRLLHATAADRYDIVFLDPPYADDSIGELCRLLDDHGWLSQTAHVYFEQDRGREPPVLPGGWTVIREKTAGQVRFSLARVGRRDA